MSSAADPYVEEPLPSPPRIKVRRMIEDTEMDLTPMIDVTFLLLIFFVLTSKLSEKVGLELPEAVAGIPVVEQQSVIISVAAGFGDGPARVFKGNEPTPENELDSSDANALESSIAAYIQQETAGNVLRSNASKKHWVLIKGAKNVKYRDIHRVAQAAAEASEEITNMAIGVLEKK